MKQLMVYVSDEFHEMLATHMIGDEVLIYGMDFYLDSFRTEPLYSESEGEDIPVLTCNAAFHTMTVSKGRCATEQIKESDEMIASLKAAKAEYIEGTPGWTICESRGLSLANINGKVVPTNEEARKALRTLTVSELFGGSKSGHTQKDYHEIEEAFMTRPK